MRSTTAFTLIALMLRFSVGVSGQEARPQQPVAPSTAPAQSFDELRARLRVGDNIIVRDVSGHTTHGRLVALTGTEMEIKWRSAFRHQQRTFTETEIRRVKLRDSAWNGALIGLGFGGAVGAIGCRAELRLSPGTVGAYGCLAYLLWAPSAGYVVAVLVDVLLINRTVYQASGTTLTLSPVVAPGRIGMGARVQF